MIKKELLQQNAVKAFIAFLIANTIWAAASPVIKLTLNDIPVFTFLLFRFLIVCIILLPFIIVELRKNPIDRRDVFNLIILGILSQGSLALFFMGLNWTSSIDAVVIGVIAPLLAVMAGHHFFNEKVTDGTKMGIAIATFGTLLVIFEPILGTNAVVPGQPSIFYRLLGNGLILTYQIMFTLYILWSKMVMGEKSIELREDLRHLNIKPMHKKYNPNLITMITFYAACAMFIPFAVLEHAGYFGGQTFTLLSLTNSSILGLIYMALLSSIVAYFLFQWALDISSVEESALHVYLTPILTIPFAYLILNELPTKGTLIGCIIIAVGVLIAEKFKPTTIVAKK